MIFIDSLTNRLSLMNKNYHKFKIQGGANLKGTVKCSGAKNAALIMIAACILTEDTVVMKNVPHIQDIHVMLDILMSMGAKVTWVGENNVSINCFGINPNTIDQNKIGRLRGSVVLIGPLLARFSKIIIHQPGGCKIGIRPIDTHINAFRNLNVNAKKNGKFYEFTTKKLTGNNVILDEISVTTTENILMAGALADGTTNIHLAAVEPEIANLIEMLELMGVKIKGKNTSNLTIYSQKKLNGCTVSVIPDRIEAGTFACAIIATKGEGIIENVIPAHIYSIVNKFEQMGIQFAFAQKNDDPYKINSLIIKKTDKIRPVNIDTRPFPGFPTDLQSIIAIALSQASCNSKIFETLFSGRLEYAKVLNKMGAQIDIIDNNNITIKGPSTLRSNNIDSPDLRAGAAFVIAALIANGTSHVSNIEIIDRGYENFDQKLVGLGAQINRV